MIRALADIRSWGPNTWRSLHTFTFAYPEHPSADQRSAYKQFFTLLQHVLPCGTCRQHYSTHLQTYPLTEKVLSSRMSLFHWLVDVHNAVNLQQGKSLYSYEKALAEQTQWHGRPFWHYAAGAVIILLLLFKCLKNALPCW